MPTPSLPAMSLIAFCARTLLPASFRRGENAAIANSPGHDGDDAAPDSGLGWQAGVERPAPRLVVEARRQHDGE